MRTKAARRTATPMHYQHISLPDDIYDWVRQRSARSYLSVSAVIRLILGEAMRAETEGRR